MVIAKYKETRGWDITNNINLDYILTNSIDINIQDDVTDIFTWSSIARYTKYDYMKMRDFAKATFIPNWNSLSTDEKGALFNHYIYPVGVSQSEIDLYLTASDQLQLWIDLAKEAKSCREKRWESARRKVSFYLTEAQTLDLYISTKDYSVEYKDANIPKLICWLANSTYAPLGIDFTINGLAQKSYYSDNIKNIMLDIIQNGNYEITN